MDAKKQKLLIEYLLSSPDVFAICNPIIETNYFVPEYKQTVHFIKQYYDQYNTIPDERQVLGETGVELKITEISPKQVEYCVNEVEKFCKQRGFYAALTKALKVFEEGDTGEAERLIHDAALISIHKDVGYEYFKDPLERLQRMSTQNPKISTGWKGLDRELDGGLEKGTLTIFTANSGGGKSVTLANLGLNMMQQGKNTLYLSLELSEDLITKRYDSMITGINQIEIFSRMKEVAHKVSQHGENCGKLVVEQFPAGTTANQFQSFLKEFELVNGYIPDVLLVDYLDLMGSNEKVSADNVFEKDKRASEQLRNIGVEYNMIVGSASQQNRGAVTSDIINQSHIAGGISKINTSDNTISIIMTDAMRAKGEMMFHLLKTRSSGGVGNNVYMKWNNVSLRITDDNGSSRDPDPTKNIPLTKKDDNQGSRLLDLMSSVK